MFMTLALNLTSAKIALFGMWFDANGFVEAFADWMEKTSEFG